MNRYKRLLVVLLSGIVLSLSAQTPDFRKLSGLVRQAAMETAISPAMTRGMTDYNNQRSITAFVKVDKQSADSIFSVYGCRKYAQWGDIAIASIPLRHLALLSKEKSVRRIEAGSHSSALLDTTAVIINALPVYQATETHSAFTGDGVVVGLMDVGFDLSHPNFYNKDLSRYRIGAIWDMLSVDTIGSTLPVGRDYIGESDILAIGHTTDAATETHGTHTLGIAAGSGYDTKYRGMAFDSDICLVGNVVNSNEQYIDSAAAYKYTNALDALGFKYLFDYAESQGKPCVASFSEGYAPYLDGDDSLYVAVLDSLTGPGRIIVASAGNEGHIKTYFAKSSDTSAAGAFINCATRQALYRLKVEKEGFIHFYAYRGEKGHPTDTLTLATAAIPCDSVISQKFACGSDSLTVHYYHNGSVFVPDDVWQILIQAPQNFNELYPIALVTEGEGWMEAFGSSRYSFTDNDIDLRWNAEEKGHSIYAPGCFEPVICVGATSHRPHGVIDEHSSIGPSMNGLTKPDVTAPGIQVISSYNHIHYPEKELVTTSDFNGISYPWGTASGTSMSAPVVAGVIALWLQANPNLTYEEVRQILSRTCRKPDNSLDYPNNIYGHGEIDAYKGLLDILGISGISDISSSQPESVRIMPAEGGIRLIFSQESSATVNVSIYQLSGTCILRKQLQPSGRELYLPLENITSGIYAVQLDSEDKRQKGSSLIRL